MKVILLNIILFFSIFLIKAQDKFFTKTGFISFYSHTIIEDIKADNNQVLCILDANNGKIAAKVLMRSFIFKKALMQEHFNENYIQSYKYPKATFKGQIVNFLEIDEFSETLIKGKLTIKGVSKDIEFKVNIKKAGDSYLLEGNFPIKVADFDIKIPAVVSKNIAKTVKVTYKFILQPYKK